MGTNITLLAERIRKDGTWERAEPFVPYPFPRGSQQAPELVREPVYNSGNRDLFAILSFGLTVEEGVRRGQLPNKAVQPVALPRGLPLDLSEESREVYEHPRWGPSDKWGESWLLLRELLEYDWNQKVRDTRRRYYGLPSPYPPLQTRRQKEAWAKRSREVENRPPNWPGWSEGRWESLGFLGRTSEGIRIEGYVEADPWGRVARETAKRFYETTLPRLQSYGDPDEVRIVFWFS